MLNVGQFVLVISMMECGKIAEEKTGGLYAIEFIHGTMQEVSGDDLVALPVSGRRIQKGEFYFIVSIKVEDNVPVFTKRNCYTKTGQRIY